MKALYTNSRYLKTHLAFFIFMMILMLLLFGKANAHKISAMKVNRCNLIEMI